MWRPGSGRSRVGLDIERCGLEHRNGSGKQNIRWGARKVVLVRQL